jgi:hypothetical protein
LHECEKVRGRKAAASIHHTRSALRRERFAFPWAPRSSGISQAGNELANPGRVPKLVVARHAGHSPRHSSRVAPAPNSKHQSYGFRRRCGSWRARPSREIH